MNTSRRVGRPPAPERDRLAVVLTVRLTQQDGELLDALAADSNPGEVVRQLIRAEHRRAQKRESMRRARARAQQPTAAEPTEQQR